MKSNIKKIIKEMIPIIAGILIAMFINNWNEDRKDAKYINKILSSINKELRESNEEITEMLIKQKSFIDTVEIYQKDEVVSIYEITNKIGIGIPSIKTNAWVALSNSRIELIDYDKLSSLANIEEGKEILKLKTDKLINFIYPNINEKGPEKKVLLKVMIQEIISTEILLQKEIEGFLKIK